MTASAPRIPDLSHVRDLTRLRRHAEALTVAQALDREMPDQADIAYLIAVNQRCLHRFGDALRTLDCVERLRPLFSLLYQERGHCFMAMRDAPRAIEAFRRGVTINPALLASWLMLERLYKITGDAVKAAEAGAHHARLQRLPPEIVQASSLFADGALEAAERILRDYRNRAGDHDEALRLLARIALQRGEADEAATLLDTVLSRTPDYRAARCDYARALLDLQKYAPARGQLDMLMILEPLNPDYRALHATACVGLGHYERAIATYRQLLAEAPTPELQLSLAHALSAMDRRAEAIEACHAAAAARPAFGDAYWSLANLKTYRFSDDEIERMRVVEAAAGAHPVDRYHLCFALGKALEDRGDYARSWAYYTRGNAQKRAETPYRPEIAERDASRFQEICTDAFFAARTHVGAQYSDPIFIVGLPRSGSTLLEQILASHPDVEGTHELADLPRLVQHLDGRGEDPDRLRYPAVLSSLAPDDFQRLGEQYIDDTRTYRTGRHYFIDKMPNNFRHIGLIHLMLPNAKIIDVRRAPMACCVSNFKQLFAGGQAFSYGLDDLARYYRSYVQLMRHWDTVLPGRVLRVCYEDLVDDLDANVRRVLAFCDLPFDPACIAFYETPRNVSTPSAAQVRQPIFRQGLEQWRHFEPWLGTLRDALGDAIIRYRD